MVQSEGEGSHGRRSGDAGGGRTGVEGLPGEAGLSAEGAEWLASERSGEWLLAEGEEEQEEYRSMLHQAVSDITRQLYQSGHYDDPDDARVEAVGILRKFHVEARRIRRARPATAQAEKYFQQQDVEIQVPAMQVGQFSSSAVPGKIIQVEQPGKYRVQIPAEGTVGGVPTELLVVDETYTQPDALNYGKIRGPLTSPGMDTGQPGIIT